MKHLSMLGCSVGALAGFVINLGVLHATLFGAFIGSVSAMLVMLVLDVALDVILPKNE
jgi:hypothetical protein